MSSRSSKACVGVGEYVNSSGPAETLAETCSGSGWAMRTTSNSSRDTNNFLRSVSSRSASTFIAVGGHVDNAHVALTLAEVGPD